jgi:hypothetical protein
MAYPTVSKPYGLQPVNLIGGQVFAGATRYRRIASAYATAIFYGDLVKLTTTALLFWLMKPPQSFYGLCWRFPRLHIHRFHK